MNDKIINACKTCRRAIRDTQLFADVSGPDRAVGRRRYQRHGVHFFDFTEHEDMADLAPAAVIVHADVAVRRDIIAWGFAAGKEKATEHRQVRFT